MIRIGQSLYGAGVIHSAAYGKSAHDPVETTRRLLLDLNLDVVEGAWVREGESGEQMRDMLTWSGCDVVYVAGGLMRAQNIDPSAATAEERAVSLDKLKTIVSNASWFGARMLLVCAGADVGPERRTQAIEHLAGCLRELCLHAEQLRPHDPLWITFEHFDRELDQKRLLGPTIETVAMIADIRRDHGNIGMTLDMSHLMQLGEDLTVAVKTAGDLAIHAHVANCGLDRSVPKAFGDSHCRFGMAGGHATLEDVATFLIALETTGYGKRLLPTRAPILTAEMKPADGEAGDLLIANGLRMLRHGAALADLRLSSATARTAHAAQS
ncbi:sugar phosphate isomerase/epimerase family protein [Devosia sp. A449]